jgi:hypothetical protein
MEQTELIEKLKKVSIGLGRLGQIAEQNSINEAIALLEKPMHDYAGQSNAIQFAKWVNNNDYYYDSEIDFWDNSTNDNGNLITSEELYQAFLNREEK